MKKKLTNVILISFIIALMAACLIALTIQKNKNENRQIENMQQENNSEAVNEQKSKQFITIEHGDDSSTMPSETILVEEKEIPAIEEDEIETKEIFVEKK